MKCALPLLFLGSCSVAEPFEGTRTVRSFDGLSRADGGWGWEDKDTSQVTPTPAPGNHRAVATVPLLAGGDPIQAAIDFAVP